MLHQHADELVFQTRNRGFMMITEPVCDVVRASGIRTGLLTLHLKHTSASLLIQENADPDVRSDLETFFRRLVPDGDRAFVHTMEGPDDMPAHVRTALTSVNLSIPVSNGLPNLGLWQGIYLWEHRQSPHRRHIAVHIIGD